MKNTLTIFLFFAFYSICHSQYPTKNIHGNILLIGVEHSDALFEAGSNKRATLMDSLTRNMFCKNYPAIKKASVGKPIIYLMEGIRTNAAVTTSAYIIERLNLPNCMETGDTIIGCDPRPDSIKIQSAIVLDMLDSIYTDGLDGTEKTFFEAFLKPYSFNGNLFGMQDLGYLYYWGKIMDDWNKSFEEKALKMARTLSGRGYFVIVLLGASHVVKIIHDENDSNIGYALCVDPKSLQNIVSGAKLLSVYKSMYSKK